MRDGEREALHVPVIQQNLDGVRAGALKNGHRRDRQNECRDEGHVPRNEVRRHSDPDLALNFWEQRVAVSVHDLYPHVMLSRRLGTVIRELHDEHHTQRGGVLSPPQDADATAKDVRLALRDLRRIREVFGEAPIP
jgi:hypothetical protein